MIRLIIWCKPFAGYILVALIIIITWLSSVPSLPTLKIHTSKSEFRLDYLIHFCEYGLLAFMAFLSSAGKNFFLSYRKYIIITLGLILFALIDEFHQKFIPGRSFNIKDIISDITGIITALVFCILVFRLIMRRYNSAD